MNVSYEPSRVKDFLYLFLTPKNQLYSSCHSKLKQPKLPLDVDFTPPPQLLPAKVIDTGSQKILTLPPLRKTIPEVTLKSVYPLSEGKCGRFYRFDIRNNDIANWDKP